MSHREQNMTDNSDSDGVDYENVPKTKDISGSDSVVYENTASRTAVGTSATPGQSSTPSSQRHKLADALNMSIPVLNHRQDGSMAPGYANVPKDNLSYDNNSFSHPLVVDPSVRSSPKETPRSHKTMKNDKLDFYVPPTVNESVLPGYLPMSGNKHEYKNVVEPNTLSGYLPMGEGLHSENARNTTTPSTQSNISKPYSSNTPNYLVLVDDGGHSEVCDAPTLRKDTATSIVSLPLKTNKKTSIASKNHSSKIICCFSCCRRQTDHDETDKFTSRLGMPR